MPKTDWRDVNYSQLYRDFYPEGLNLKPGETDHDEIRDMILDRAHESERVMSARHPKWEEIDETLTAYIPLDELEQERQAKDSRKPVSIVVPESYAQLETLLTYMLAAFGEGPMFRYEGVGPEDVLGAMLMEKLIDNQVKKSKALLSLHTQWRDAFTYGLGIVALSWEVKTGKRTTFKPEGYYHPLTGQYIQTHSSRITVDSVLFEGTTITPIDPYMYLPDPNVALHEPQKGEWVGWVDRDNLMSLRRAEAEPDSIYFNIRYLEHTAGSRSSVYMIEPAARTLEGTSPLRNRGTEGLTHPVDVIYFYIDIIPKMWRLGDSEKPEKWMFALANDLVIIAAHPMNLNHEMFPVAVCAPDFGGHETMPISRMEIIFGLQKGLNWFYNSHATEVYRMLRNRLIYDPKLIRREDVDSDKPMIRTRKVMWGRGVKDTAIPLPITNATQNHLSDMMTIRDISRNVSGAVDSLQGLQRTHGERVTAKEFEGTRGAALSRMQKAARIISLQSMSDIAQMYAYHTQQFMSEAVYIKTAGRWEETLRAEYGIVDPRYPVTPYDLDIAFDVDIHDGSIEGGEFADSWLTVWDIISRNPELMQRIDTTRVFMHIARLLKAKNIQEFLRRDGGVNAQVLPDQQVQDQAERGAIQPVEGAV